MKQGEVLSDTAQSNVAARLDTIQVNLAESTINMSRMEDVNNEEASDGEEKDYQEDEEGNMDEDGDVNDEDGEGNIPNYNPFSDKDSIWYTLANVNGEDYVWKDDTMNTMTIQLNHVMQFHRAEP